MPAFLMQKYSKKYAKILKLCINKYIIYSKYNIIMLSIAKEV